VFSIHSAAQLQKTGGGGDALLSNPIGTGPYAGKVGSWHEIDWSPIRTIAAQRPGEKRRHQVEFGS